VTSLRARTALAFALVAAIVAGGMGGAVYALSAADRGDRARTLQSQRAQIAASVYRSTQRLVLGATLNDPAAPASLRAAVRRGDVASFRSGTAVWAGAPAGAAAVLVRGSFAEDQRALQTLRTTLGWAGAGATVAGALVGLLLASGLSRRLRRAAATARRIGDGELSARIGVAGHDEVGALAAAVDRMADSLRDRIERERSFAADVAHELRTPVTGLVSAAALLPTGEVPELVRGRTARLRSLVEELLEISRLEGGGERAEERWVDLAALAHETAEPYAADVRVIGGAPPEAWTDPRRVVRVLTNLLENAIRHGAPPVVVQVERRRIAVIDAGPGFPPELLGRATDRFVSGHDARGEGAGLGLAIAAGHARVIGAVLELGNREEGGAIVAISLPQRDGSAIVDA
jgi:signal transduction histidine kinase